MPYVTDVQLGPDGKPRLDLVEPSPPVADELSRSELADVEDEHVSLCEVLDRVLNKGVVVKGEIVITVADIELLYLGLELLLCSVDKARRVGVRLPHDQTAPPMLPAAVKGPLKTLR